MAADAQPTTDERIVQAARATFMERGFDGARMQDIADRADTNKALLHYYFRSKRKLFEVVFADVLRLFHDTFLEVLRTEASYLDKIRAIVAKDIDVLLRNPDIPLFVVSEIARHPTEMSERALSAGMPELLAEFTRQTKAATRAGEIRPVDPTDLFLNILALNRFPFIARGLMTTTAGIPETEFDAMMARRKQTVADLLTNDLQLHE